jgi:uncharacterized protein
VEGLDSVQIRVLGCLLEKQRTTPDAYPLTLNSLRIACNQATSRDPVVDYDEATVQEAAQRLGRRGWARLASYHGSRSPKYRHLLDEALGLSPDELALLCVLMLRGPQTLGELKQRSERLHPFGDLRSAEETLDRLTARELGRWLERTPGQKEARYTHLLDGGESAIGEPEPMDADPPPQQAGPDDLADEVARMAPFVHELRVRYGECDPQGIVFNANYLMYFDVAFTELWREAVGPWQQMVEQGVDAVVGEINARFLAPARFDDVIQLRARVTRLGKTSITTEIHVMRDGEVLVAGSLRHVVVDVGTWGPTGIPEWVRTGLARFTAPNVRED